MLEIEKGNRDCLYSEFREWIEDTNFDDDETWSIPDLTDEGLRDFFKRAISQ
ncbi:hypothetical protein EV05_1383 [Prochlorococcus sp. MIT 0601]|nr:hypothetical protein EV05_1383 [Prochlorococcus sp. MIT 0601]